MSSYVRIFSSSIQIAKRMAVISFKTIGDEIITVRVKDVTAVQGGGQTCLIMLASGKAYTVFGTVDEIKAQIESVKKKPRL
jgi:hypothetical protein